MNSQNETEIIGVFIRSPEHELNMRDARAVLFGAGYSQGFWTQGDLSYIFKKVTSGN
jgi:hypothetical protein